MQIFAGLHPAFGRRDLSEFVDCVLLSLTAFKNHNMPLSIEQLNANICWNCILLLGRGDLNELVADCFLVGVTAFKNHKSLNIK